MVMIRCPSCGQRALDVATSCPRCGHVLIQNPLETHGGSSLIACGRCGKHIDRGATVCPFCGHHVRRARVAGRFAWSAVALLAVVGGVALAARAGYLPDLVPGRSPPAVATPEPTRVAPSFAADSAVTAPPIVAAPAAPAVPETDREVLPRPPASRLAPSSSPGPRLQTRWTAEWANVREGRGIDTPIVGVLRPGARVEVAEMRDGWWALYLNGELRGFIANSVLVNQPPTTP